MFVRIVDDLGNPLDARIELENDYVVVHSRGGAFGKPNLRNPDHRKALTLILQRLKDSSVIPAGILLDSRIAQAWPESDRSLISASEFGLPVEKLVTLIGQRGAAKGRPLGATGHGNSTKRVRVAVPSTSAVQLEAIIRERVSASAKQSEGALADERTWAEGSPRRQEHLRRERATGLARVKKRNFVEQHGHLFCERCGLVPSRQLGPFGDACIEVHHSTLAVGQMDGATRTRLADLQCLCANCHRITHREQL